MALVGCHLGKQSLRHLGSLHLLLDLIINGRGDVDQWLQFQGEVRIRTRGLRLQDAMENRFIRNKNEANVIEMNKASFEKNDNPHIKG